MTGEKIVVSKIGGRLFSDEVIPATTLYRQGKAVLDLARERPVTITRNDQHFALMRRELARWYAAIADQVTRFSEVMLAITTRQQGGLLSAGHPFQWINAFGSTDLIDFSEELIRALPQSVRTDETGDIEAVIVKWKQRSMSIKHKRKSRR